MSVSIFASVTVVSPLCSAEMSDEEASEDLPVSMQLHRANFGLSEWCKSELLFCSLSKGFDNCVILLILVFIQS